MSINSPTTASPDQHPGPHGTADLLLRGGRVIDPESGLDDVVDLAVNGGRITAVGAAAPRAREVLDVSGKVVTAGFIDLHSHAQTIPSLRLQALDGVTTALELESGAGDVGVAYAAAAREGRPINFGYSASWAQARMQVLCGSTRPGGFLDFAKDLASNGWQQPADRCEVDAILGRLEEQVGAGALGMGVLVGYAPQTGRSEYFQVAQLAARLGVPTFTHARFKNPDDPHTALEGAAEVVAAAAGTGAHMHLCHLNSTSLRAIDEVAELVGGARDRGVSISTEAYPYGAGMTAIGAPFLHPDNLGLLGIAPSQLVYVSTGERPRDAARLLELQDQDPGGLCIIHYLDEGDDDDLALLRKAMLLSDTAVASDAIPFTTPDGRVVETDAPLGQDVLSHPRTSGTFARFLRMMVRETRALSMSEALARCSLVPANVLSAVCPGMAAKGRVQVGKDADLVVFDPDTVADRSTYANPGVSSAGFEHVLVRGELVVRDGDPVPASLPGHPVIGAGR